MRPILGAVDENNRRRWITKMLNDELGTNLDPWSWDTWPVEFIETMSAYVTKDIPDNGE